MNTPMVFVICGNNCKYESMTKEQILTAIIQAVNEGTIGNIDTGFVQTIKTINGKALRFFVGTQAQYNALTDADKENLFAIISDDATKENIEKLLKSLQEDIDSVEKRIDETDKSNDLKFKNINNRLNKIGVMPTLNTAKQISALGYNYVHVVWKRSYNGYLMLDGVVFYNPMNSHDEYDYIEFASTYDGVDEVIVSVGAEGNIRVFQYNADRTTSQEVTDECDIYTALIIGY